MNADLANDILRGVKNIANFINEDARATYHKLATGALPGGKEGNQWIASKRVLVEHYAKITAGKAA
ncbi:hypothetical protein N2603_23390 [Bradyrhizobium huanghuaihaiense]|uniref:hypothetical protein n=1 Tax=Bradyrhizobium huanghuaihaiense TaxID=990078 RepID=UPI0021A9A810|nr:hypothetical protein [Bradyrhizobium sp. CB3035]UWU73051.1 hypothetical protein N2603_23390 [Bradyrhizobium sp. CB3035]